MARQLRPASIVATKLRNEGKLNTVEGIMMMTEKVAALLGSNNRMHDQIQPSIVNMFQQLKTYGCHLEALYKEQLDRIFVAFRNACQDDTLDFTSRAHLLQLIELRANQWITNEHMQQYYATHVEEAANNRMAEQIFPNFDANQMSFSTLNAGELMRSSGKFSKSAKTPGKNYLKDEVVIRNADSGKVMGIKGRRVHMIEELSETIISFQRVPPGVKERLVQITGSNEDSIKYAKRLIEDTIRRNASPVSMAMPASKGSSSTLSSSDDIDETFIGKNLLPRSFSTSNTQAIRELPDFKYTVTVGEKMLKITGMDLDLVRTAKLVLDEYFCGILGDAERFISVDELWSVTPWNDHENVIDLTKKIYCYDRDQLLKIAKSCKINRTPDNWSKLIGEFPNILSKDVTTDVEMVLNGGKRPDVVVVSDDDGSSNSDLV